MTHYFQDVFVLSHYDENGIKSENCTKMMLDLREDAKVMVTGGLYKGLKGEVVGKRKEGIFLSPCFPFIFFFSAFQIIISFPYFHFQGHYKVRVMHPLNNFVAPKEHTLGVWWVECSILGLTPEIPIVNCDESLKFF